MSGIGLPPAAVNQFPGLGTRGLFTREDGVTGAEIIRDPKFPRGLGVCADRLDFRKIEHERRDHPGWVGICRGLHGFAANPHDAQAISEGECARKRECGVFAETQAGCESTGVDDLGDCSRNISTAARLHTYSAG